MIEGCCQGGIHLLATDEARCSIKTLTRTDCLCCTALHCVALHRIARYFNRLFCRVGRGGEEQLGSEPGQQENEHKRAYSSTASICGSKVSSLHHANHLRCCLLRANRPPVATVKIRFAGVAMINLNVAHDKDRHEGLYPMVDHWSLSWAGSLLSRPRSEIVDHRASVLRLQRNILCKSALLHSEPCSCHH